MENRVILKLNWALLYVIIGCVKQISCAGLKTMPVEIDKK